MLLHESQCNNSENNSKSNHKPITQANQIMSKLRAHGGSRDNSHNNNITRMHTQYHLCHYTLPPYSKERVTFTMIVGVCIKFGPESYYTI